MVETALALVGMVGFYFGTWWTAQMIAHAWQYVRYSMGATRAKDRARD